MKGKIGFKEEIALIWNINSKELKTSKGKKQKHSKKSPVLSTDEHETDELIGELWLCILDTMGGVSGIELRISALILGASLLNIESAKLDLLCE